MIRFAADLDAVQVDGWEVKLKERVAAGESLYHAAKAEGVPYTTARRRAQDWSE